MSKIEKKIKKACKKGNVELAKKLIKKIADKDLFWSGTYACKYGHLELVKYINEIRPDTFWDNYSIGDVCIGGYVDLYKYMMEKCNTSDRHGWVLRGHEYGTPSIHKYMIEDNILNPRVLTDNQAQVLLNLGVDGKKIEYKGRKFIDARINRNKEITMVLLENTTICVDVVVIVCSYTEY